MPTAAVRQAVRLGSGAGGLFVVLVLLGSRLDVFTGPVHTAIWFAVFVTAVAALPTGIRSLAHRGAAPLPTHVAQTVIGGCLVATTVMAAAALGVAVALVTRLVTAGPALSDLPLAALLVMLAGCLRGAFSLQTRAGALWSDQLGAQQLAATSPARPDIVDDIATLIATAWPGSGAARSASRLDRALDRWAFSPRRHRTTFTAAGALLIAVLLATWYKTAQGWPSPVVEVIFIAFSAGVVGYALSARPAGAR